MTDDSKLVLRWEIDDATVVHAVGQAESDVFNEGGFMWTAKAEREITSVAKLTLECDILEDGPWKCKANVSVGVYTIDGSIGRTEMKFDFDQSNNVCCFPVFAIWNVMIHPNYNNNDKVTFEFQVHIISSERGEPTPVGLGRFAEPNSMSNVILKIGDQKLHVSKEYLATQSAFFEKLFFGNFAEKGKEEVEINDVAYEEFLDLLNVVYLEDVEMTDNSILHILKLADRFQMERVLDMSKKYLIRSKTIYVAQKLIMADQYRLHDLRDFCLKSFSNFAELQKMIKSSPELNKSSDAMKAAIYDRILFLVIICRMTDNSTIVLLWKIDNATAVYSAGKAESEVFNEGGFRWTARAEPERRLAKVTLRCGVVHDRHWKCEADVSLCLLRADGTFYGKHKKFFFNDKRDSVSCKHVYWTFLTDENYNIDDKVTLEFRVQIISSEGGEPIDVSISPFAEPTNRSDVILKIGDEKLHVSKEYLAVQSPFFENLFFGDFVEKGKDEVEIKDVVYKEFLAFLNVVYLMVEITNRTVLHVLKLADRFQMKNVEMLSQNFLIQSNDFDVLRKLIMADKYRLAELRDNYLNSFSSVTELHEKIKSSPEVANFSDEMKASIFDRTLKLLQ